MFVCSLDVKRKDGKLLRRFRERLNRIDGTVVEIPEDCSYVDVRIPEGNYELVRWVGLSVD